nr:iron ABC transporter permease [Ureaplasma urealyticum]
MQLKPKFENRLNFKRYFIYKWSIFGVLILLTSFIFLFNIIYTNKTFIWQSFYFQKASSEEVFLLFFYSPIILLVCGVGLVCSGFSLQSTTRNGLAGPSTLGIFPLAALGSILSQLITKSFSNIFIGYAFGIVFSLIALGINFLFIKMTPHKKTFKPILFGFSLGAIITAINVLIANFHSSIVASPIQLLGSVGVYSSIERFYIGVPIVFISTIVLLCYAKKIQILYTSHYLAKSLGININRMYWITSICSIFIAISTTFLIGGLSLIAIVMPHLSRLLFKRTNYLFQMIAAIFLTCILLQLLGLVVEFFSKFNIVFLVATVLAIPMIVLLKWELGWKVNKN